MRRTWVGAPASWFDNDGLLDLFVANGHVYPDIGGLLPEKPSRGVASGDNDNDGDIDAVVVNLNERPTLIRNDTPPGNHWTTLCA